MSSLCACDTKQSQCDTERSQSHRLLTRVTATGSSRHLLGMPSELGCVQFCEALCQTLCHAVLKNAVSAHQAAYAAAVQLLAAVLLRPNLRSTLRAELGAFIPLMLLRPLETDRCALAHVAVLPAVVPGWSCCLAQYPTAMAARQGLSTSQAGSDLAQACWEAFDTPGRLHANQAASVSCRPDPAQVMASLEAISSMCRQPQLMVSLVCSESAASCCVQACS